MKLLIFRRQRSKRIGYEWHNYNGVRYLNVWWGSPTDHKWWAMNVYLYLTGA